MTLHRCATALASLALVALASPAGAAVPKDVLDVDSGLTHTCYVTSCGDVECFGRNNHHQAENKLRTRYPIAWGTPVQAPFVEVTVGNVHTCALDETGRVKCWGNSREHRLSVPATLMTTIDAGHDFTCGLDANGYAHCWGDRAPAPPVGVRFDALSAGGRHACGVERGGARVRCWGDDTYGQARTANVLFPTPLSERFTEVSAGGTHTCAVSNFGYLYCWGDNRYGAVDFGGRLVDDDGDGVYVYQVQRLSQVAAGAWGTCVHYHPNTAGSSTASDKTWCWGYPFDLGGAYTPPTALTQQLTVGSGYACGVDAASNAFCFGNSSVGAASPPAQGGQCPFELVITGPRDFGW